MITSHVRLLYLPNEGKKNGLQIEARTAFEGMLQSSELRAYEVFSYWDELEATGDPKRVHEKLYEIAQTFQPDILLWQHPTDFPVCGDTLRRIKSLPFAPLVVYDERDSYIWPQKPLPKGAKTLACLCDIAFTSGLVTTGNLIARAGAGRVFYSPTAMDVRRFKTAWEPLSVREFDAVMICNVPRLRYPLLRLPGTKERYQLAERLFDVLGKRFVAFGHGWPRRPYAKGPLPFEQQTETIRSAWLSVGWDHCTRSAYYFSDRLPIAMMSGVVHVTNYKPGFEHIFKNGSDLFFANTIDDVVAAVQYVLSLSVEDRIAIGRSGAEFAGTYLSGETVFRRLIQRCVEEIASRKGRL
jgi:hypothetical protein